MSEYAGVEDFTGEAVCRPNFELSPSHTSEKKKIFKNTKLHYHNTRYYGLLFSEFIHILIANN